ncbi:MAG: hypothetical protein IPM27_10155 [Nitrosomonadales bacterium]|nr:hypothetical protein [Nitrosomonadales bacterium]
MMLLIVLVLGLTVVLVKSLSATDLNTKRQMATATALAQAKDALLGRAVSDDNMPGSLPCPDTDDDGSAEMFSGNNCPSYIGRLPWRTLKLQDLRDGTASGYGMRCHLLFAMTIRLNRSTATPRELCWYTTPMARLCKHRVVTAQLQ